MIQIGLIGFGNVGQDIYRILNENGPLISERLGQPLVIKKIAVRTLEKYKNVIEDTSLLTTDVNTIINDSDISIIVEVIGGEIPALDYITTALTNKKHVVTANKEVISKHKKHFFKMAHSNGVDIYFEAAVGGGIPIIRSLKVGFAANNINAFYGIINGTTNYILTKIKEEKKEFNTILKQAQDLGFAELDPTMDISGLDAAYKCSILAAVAFKIDSQVSDIAYTGIETVTLKDLNYATELGYAIRLLAQGKRLESNKFELQVCPALIPINHPLASVHNEFNAVYIVGDQVGESMLMGKGAGGSPTASAIISDIMDISFGISQHISSRNLETNFQDSTIQSLDETTSYYYLRLNVKNQPGVLEQISLQFSEKSISIEKIIQKESTPNDAEIVIITNSIQHYKYLEVASLLNKLNVCQNIESTIRLYKNL
ncbi:homoserine dehydrogenase [Candidatus Marinamargulisbacteria bacterium SCGC AG-333-B06]|nr:homoserine dehydrogenase [Candidatus Marinamargulisbacteria bacterium SCGC AG-333-B06]